MGEFRRAFGSMLAGGLIIGIVNLAMQIWFARSLGIHVIGNYGLIAVFVGLVSVFTSIGINQAVIGIGYDRHRQEVALFLSLVQAGVVAGLFAVAGAALAVFAPASFDELAAPGLLSALGAILIMPANALTCAIEARLEYGRLSSMRVCAFVFANLGAVLLFFLGAGIFTIVARDLLNASLYLALAAFAATRSGPIRPKADWSAARELLRFSRGIWLNNVTTEGAKRIDMGLAAIFLGPTAFGIYFQTRALVEGALGFITYPVQSAVFSFLRKHRDRINFAFIANAVIGTTVLMALAGFAAASLLGPFLITTVLGEAWRVGGYILAPLAAYAAIALYFEVKVSIAKARDRMRDVLAPRLLSLAAVVIVVPVFVQLWGIYGAAYATLATSLVLAWGTELFVRLRRPEA